MLFIAVCILTALYMGISLAYEAAFWVASCSVGDTRSFFKYWLDRLK